MNALFLVLLTLTFSMHSKDEWRKRTIYQLLTDRFSRTDASTAPCSNLGNYCGGTYKGIANNLDYITGMGFDAIWISPIIDNTPGGYHGYWARNFYELNSAFGTKDEFKELVRKCHEKDIWVMVDVVANHVGPVGTDYSSINPFNKAEHYHSRCDIHTYCDFNNQANIEYCRLADLPDLD